MNSSALPNTAPMIWCRRHLLGIEGLSAQEITYLLDRAERWLDSSQEFLAAGRPLLGRTVLNFFFEESTRTRTSFEFAAKRLGAYVISAAQLGSSIAKGETLIDTATTLNAMHPDILVVRHPCSGAVGLLAEKVSCRVINAGDGRHEHPTQALLDALTIRRRKGRIAGLKIAICGDVVHSRVARSNIHLLHTLGAKLRLVGPASLLPAAMDDICCYYNMAEGIRDCDIIIMLRLQHERMRAAYVPSLREYFHFFGLDRKVLAHAHPDVLVMHPGPVNRGVEIDSVIVDDPECSLIHQQVETGVAVRMAVLDLFGDTDDAVVTL